MILCGENTGEGGGIFIKIIVCKAVLIAKLEFHHTNAEIGE